MMEEPTSHGAGRSNERAVRVDPTTGLAAWLAEGRCREVLSWYASVGSTALDAFPEALALVATAAARTADYALAEELAQRTLEVSELNEHARLRALNILGGLAFQQSRLADASCWYHGAYKLALASGRQDILARVMNNLGAIHHLQGDDAAAETLYCQALETYEKLGDNRGLAETHHNLSLMFRESSRSSAANEATQLATRHAQLTGDPSLIGMVLAGKVENDLQDDNARLEELLVDAAHLAYQSRDSVGEIEVRRLRAAWRLRHGGQDLGSAAFAAEAARAEAARLGNRFQYAECAVLAAKAWEGLGANGVARLRWEEAERLFEDLGAVRNLQQLRRESGRFKAYPDIRGEEEGNTTATV